MAGQIWKKSQYPGVRYYEHQHGRIANPDAPKSRQKIDCYFSLRFKVRGKLHEEGLGWMSHGWSAEKANKLLAELKENIKTGESPQSLAEKRELEEQERARRAEEEAAQARSRLTFEELWQKYLTWAKTSKKHWEHDERYYRKHLKEALGHRRLKEIDLNVLQDLKAHLQEQGLAPATVKHCIILVRQMYNKASLWGWWEGANPVKPRSGIIPKLDNTQLRVLTHEEEEQLLPALAKKSQNTHDMAVVSLYGGLRFSEIAELRWQHIDFKSNRIIVHGKGDRIRHVPLNKTLHELFSRRYGNGKEPTALIFPDRLGNVPGKVSGVFPRTVKDLKLNKGRSKRYKVTFHTLRHTFATRLAEAGTPLTVLRDLLGHADLQMVSRYAHLSPSVADAAVAGLDRRKEEERSGKVIRMNQSAEDNAAGES